MKTNQYYMQFMYIKNSQFINIICILLYFNIFYDIFLVYIIFCLFDYIVFYYIMLFYVLLYYILFYFLFF